MDLRLDAFSKSARFKDLVETVQNCTLCPRLCDRTKVLSPKNGNTESAVLFIAEAPGRLGADRTGIPLYGDQTGNNFERLLGAVGWKRQQVFLTNAILCNPREGNGNNGTPTNEELANCSLYLEMTINIVDPAVVVTLGTTALKALEHISRHGLTLRNAVGKAMPWAGRKLVPLYHPGARALVHRGFAKQTSDFQRLAKLVHPTKGLARRRSPRTTTAKPFSLDDLTPFQHLVCLLVQTLGRITYFRLTKLLYLIDLAAIDAYGRSITGEIYIRQPDGPWPPALKKELPSLDGMEVVVSYRRRVPMVEPGPSRRFEPILDDQSLELVAEVIAKYGTLNNSEIKSVAYKTSPMRFVLSQERQGRDMQRFPIIYKDKAAPTTDNG